jgi:hypothetical protein
MPYVLLVGGCTSSSNVTAPPPSKISFSVVGGNSQSGPVNQRLPVALRARVTTPTGQPVPNFTLNFVVTSGGGSVFGGAEVTNSQGYAEEQWTLGPRLGPQTVEARTVNPATGVAASYGNFTATATPPHTVPVVTTTGGVLAIMNADASGYTPITLPGGRVASDASLATDHVHAWFSTSLQVPSIGTVTEIDHVARDGTGFTVVDSLIYPDALSSPALSPNDASVAYSTTNGGVPAAPLPGNGLNCVSGNSSYSPDGRAIVYTLSHCLPSGVYVWLMESNSATRIVDNATAGRWSPDGHHIVVGIGSQGYIVDPDGNNLTPIPNLTTDASWSPDGQLFAVGAGYMNVDGTNYVAVNHCPCRFPWK